MLANRQNITPDLKLGADGSVYFRDCNAEQKMADATVDTSKTNGVGGMLEAQDGK
jgi:hypothetical protein